MMGNTISHYRIIDKMGQGGMGQFCLAQTISSDRTNGALESNELLRLPSISCSDLKIRSARLILKRIFRWIGLAMKGYNAD